MGDGRAGEGEHTLVCGKAHFWAHWTALGFFTLPLIFFRASKYTGELCGYFSTFFYISIKRILICMFVVCSGESEGLVQDRFPSAKNAPTESPECPVL